MPGQMGGREGGRKKAPLPPPSRGRYYIAEGRGSRRGGKVEALKGEKSEIFFEGFSVTFTPRLFFLPPVLGESGTKSNFFFAFLAVGYGEGGSLLIDVRARVSLLSCSGVEFALPQREERTFRYCVQ